MKKLLLINFILAVFVGSVFAQLSGNPETFCRNGSFTTDSQEFNLGYVKAKKGERVYFYKDSEKCPKGKNCKTRTYLVNGNEVLTSRKYGNFVCAWYERKKGKEFVGWIKSDKVEYHAYLTQKYEPWIGDWKFHDNNLKIERIGKTEDYNIRGKAFWKGLGNNIHIGEVDTKGTLNESIIKLKQDDCEIKLDLVIHYLVVSDNLKCGGLNVTFSGVYRRY